MAKFEILRSDDKIVTIEIGADQKAAASEAWKEWNRVANGTYAVLMTMVSTNGKRVECASYPAALGRKL